MRTNLALTYNMQHFRQKGVRTTVSRTRSLTVVLIVLVLCCGPVPKLGGQVNETPSDRPVADVATPGIGSAVAQQEVAGSGEVSGAGDVFAIDGLGEHGDLQVAQQLSEAVAASEWLGPLAPVALSPFFGITCLSGLALFGDEFLPANHALLRSDSPLNNPTLFAVFLVLTILTSVPRLSKVSKPLAQCVDRLEAYAGIITLLVIRYLSTQAAPELEPTADVVLRAGPLELSFEVCMAVATAVNILVINGVKWFFEILVWLTPIPTVDAIFEASNKLVCAALMGIYAYSPTLATAINLLILGCCLMVFVWVRRREVYYRTMLWDFLRRLLGRYASCRKFLGGLSICRLWRYPEARALSTFLRVRQLDAATGTLAAASPGCAVAC